MTAALGDVATGALVAREVDGAAAGTRGYAGGGHAGGLCLNCGTRLVGEHCHACGQAGHVHRTLGAIGHEIAHGVFHFEGRIWRTLPMLILRPGELTRRYVAGERVRFVAPLAIFLFTVFLMFAAINAVAGGFGVEEAPARRHKVSAETQRQLGRVKADLARVEAERTRLAAAGRPTEDADGEAAMLRATISGLEMVSTDVGPVRFRSDWPTLDHALGSARKNPDLLIYKFQSSAYKYSWALIPLSTPFVALLFLWRRRFGLYDHAVFVTYSLSFMMLLVIVLTLAGAVGLSDGWIVFPALLAPPAHMFVQLRGAYGLSKRSAAWRTAVLLVFAFVVLAGFAVALLFNGLSH